MINVNNTKRTEEFNTQLDNGTSGIELGLFIFPTSAKTSNST